MTDEREHGIAAWHESAHAAVARRLGFPIHVVSIRPGAGHGGLAWIGGADAPRPAPGHPAIFQRWDVRARIEAWMAFSLAGSVAERWAAWPSAEPVHDDATALRLATVLAETGGRAVELLADAETALAAAEPMTDEDDALRLARELGAEGQFEVWAHVEYVRSVAARMVHEDHDAIAALVQALLVHEMLDGAAVDAILAPHERSGFDPLSKGDPMPKSKIKIPPVDPSAIHTPLRPDVAPDFVARTTTRLRGDHEEVRLRPELWIPDGTDGVTRRQIEAERFPEPEPATDEGRTDIYLPQPLTRWQDAMICTEPFDVRLGDSMLRVQAGDRASKTDARLKSYRRFSRDAVEGDFAA